MSKSRVVLIGPPSPLKSEVTYHLVHKNCFPRVDGYRMREMTQYGDLLRDRQHPVKVNGRQLPLEDDKDMILDVQATAGALLDRYGRVLITSPANRHASRIQYLQNDGADNHLIYVSAEPHILLGIDPAELREKPWWYEFDCKRLKPGQLEAFKKTWDAPRASSSRYRYHRFHSKEDPNLLADMDKYFSVMDVLFGVEE